MNRYLQISLSYIHIHICMYLCLNIAHIQTQIYCDRDPAFPRQKLDPTPEKSEERESPSQASVLWCKALLRNAMLAAQLPGT